MKPRFLLVLFLSIWGVSFCTIASAEKPKDSSDESEPVVDEPVAKPTASAIPPTATPTAESATPTPNPAKNSRVLINEKALVVHKPMPNPAWGKVIQYHREQNFALTESNREITHEFLFQDDEGIVRTAIFHENASGNGYWEVWVWDQQ